MGFFKNLSRARHGMAIANAKQLFQQGQHQQAIATLEGLLNTDPEFHHVRYILGEFHSELGNWDKAKECYQTICRADATAHAAWINLSTAHKNQGRHDLEVECLERAISIRPNIPEYWIGLGLANMSRTNYREALIAFGKAVEIQPQLASKLQNKWLECMSRMPEVEKQELAHVMFGNDFSK